MVFLAYDSIFSKARLNDYLLIFWGFSLQPIHSAELTFLIVILGASRTVDTVGSGNGLWVPWWEPSQSWPPGCSPLLPPELLRHTVEVG